jgi:hypothetical protein
LYCSRSALVDLSLLFAPIAGQQPGTRLGERPSRSKIRAVHLGDGQGTGDVATATPALAAKWSHFQQSRLGRGKPSLSSSAAGSASADPAAPGRVSSQPPQPLAAARCLRLLGAVILLVCAVLATPTAMPVASAADAPILAGRAPNHAATPYLMAAIVGIPEVRQSPDDPSGYPVNPRALPLGAGPSGGSGSGSDSHTFLAVVVGVLALWGFSYLAGRAKKN